MSPELRSLEPWRRVSCDMKVAGLTAILAHRPLRWAPAAQRERSRIKVLAGRSFGACRSAGGQRPRRPFAPLCAGTARDAYKLGSQAGGAWVRPLPEAEAPR